MEFPEIGSCCDTDVDAPDVFIAPEGSCARHPVRIVLDEREPDTVHYVILTELFDSIPGVSIEMPVDDRPVADQQPVLRLG